MRFSDFDLGSLGSILALAVLAVAVGFAASRVSGLIRDSSRYHAGSLTSRCFSLLLNSGAFRDPRDQALVRHLTTEFLRDNWDAREIARSWDTPAKIGWPTLCEPVESDRAV